MHWLRGARELEWAYTTRTIVVKGVLQAACKNDVAGCPESPTLREPTFESPAPLDIGSDGVPAPDGASPALDTLLALFTAPVTSAWPDPLAWWMQQCTLSEADVLERLASERWDDGWLSAEHGEASVDHMSMPAKPGPSSRSPVVLDDDDLLDAAAMLFDDDNAMAASMGDAHAPAAASSSGRPAAVGPAVPVVSPTAGFLVVDDPLDAMDDDDLMILQVPDSLMMTPAPPSLPPVAAVVPHAAAVVRPAAGVVPPAAAVVPSAPHLPRPLPPTVPAHALVLPSPTRTSAPAPAPALVDVDEDTFEDMPGFLDSIDLLEKQGRPSGLFFHRWETFTALLNECARGICVGMWAVISGAKHAPVAVVRL